MRSDYKPAETFCCIDGHLIKGHQIGGNIQGNVMDMTGPGVITVSPFDGWVCIECMNEMKRHIEGGLPQARRRAKEIARLDESEVGEQNTTRDRNVK
jgi:hypothetical protein